MRTTTAARDEPPAAEEPAEAAAVNPEPMPEMPPPAEAAHSEQNPEPRSVAVTAVRMLKLEEGLYALRLGRIDGSPGEISGMRVPVAHVSAPFAEDGNGVEVVASFPRRGPWLDREGGTAIIRSPLGGGYVMVTAYGQPDKAAIRLSLDLRRIDRGDAPGPSETAAGSAGGDAPASLTEARDIATEILLHIERAGDRLFPGRGWVGALGRKLRIEAFSVRPLERLAPTDIELKGFLPNGAETQWVHGGILCGTRGRRLPLIGFAVRVAAHLADRFEAIYQGSFFNGGISGVSRNGEPCRAIGGDDQLEALNIRVVERAAGSEKVDPAV
jgi:hypothetical protein